MRRHLTIRVSFSPTRMSQEYLRETYEMVTRVSERTIVTASEETKQVDGLRRPMARTRRSR
jgi:hypothetical protein